MSTKIYNSFIFDKEYSLHDMIQLLEPVIQNLKKDTEQEIFESVACDFLYSVNAGHVDSNQWNQIISENIENYSKNVDDENRDIWRFIRDKHYALLWVELLRKSISRLYTSKIKVIPIKGKLLCMYFGSVQGLKLFRDQKFVSEYNYYDNYDRPSNISEEEWNQRRDDWEEAIGPDYVPSHHGCTLELFYPTDIQFITGGSSVEYTDVITKNVIKRLVPLYPETVEFIRRNCNSVLDIEVQNVLRSDEYKEYEKEAMEKISQMCKLPNNIEEFWGIVSDKH